LLTRYHSRTNQ